MSLFKRVYSRLYRDLPEHVEDEKFDLEKEYPEFKGWEMIGMHRPLGDQLWEVTIEIFTLIISLFTIGILTKLLFPFPEIQGYGGLAASVFAVANRLFDVGIGFGIGRFIAQYRIHDTERMFMYIRFYVWYQMFAGLLQMSFISFFLFQITIKGQFGYLSYLIIFGLARAWPGMFGVVNAIIGGLQHYDKVNILGFIQGQVFQQFTQLGFVLLGKWYGTQHPDIGLIMGMAIGYSIGTYIDDILILFISTRMLKKILKPLGFGVGDIFMLRVDKEVAKESIYYGFQNSMFPIINSFNAQLLFYWYVSFIPGLATWQVLSGVASGLTGVLNTFGSFSLTNSIAESYCWGKRELAEWYVTTNLKWRYYFTTMFTYALLGALPLIEYFINQQEGLEYYQAAMIFFVPHLIVKYLDPFKQIVDNIFYGALFITQFNILRLIEEVIELFFVWLWLFPLRIQDMGIGGIIFLVGLKTRVSVLIKTLLAFWYIQKRILKVHIKWYATMVLPLIAGFPMFIVSILWRSFIFYPMVNSFLGIYGALIISILFLLLGAVFWVYVPLTGALGWWSDYELFIFRAAIKLSGPSKPLFKTFYKIIEKGVKVGKKVGLHGKYSPSHDVAHQQIRELLEMKREQDSYQRV